MFGNYTDPNTVALFDGDEPEEVDEEYPASLWEIDRFNNKNLYKSRWVNLDIRCRTLKVIFSNNKKDEAMRIYGYSLLLSQRDVR